MAAVPAQRLRVRTLRPGAHVPARQSALASGYDLRACLDGDSLLIEGTPVLVPTGLAIATPAGLDAQVRPRSGLSSRGLMAVFGTLDADYRGELFVTLYALPGTGPHVVSHGDRIAQLVVGRLIDVEWEPVDDLDSTERGAGGHGSTGSR